MLKRFKIGGIHPVSNKLSAGVAIESFPLMEQVVIPLSQHIGAPATATVQKGDKVVVGQLIGRANGFVSSNIHSSVSGTVMSVDGTTDAGGLRKPAVTIAVEGDLWSETIDRSEEIVRECRLSPKEIIERITDAGVVGMGGATFPTQVKLAVPEGKKAECLIVNGAECEPYLTADHRVMLEHGEEMLVGVSILMKALNVKRAYVGVENNKPDAITNLAGLAIEFEGIEIVPLRVQYPQGGEKQLIDAIVGRRVPPGALPIEVGAVVQNVGTAFAVYEAVQKNKPLIDRVVTVTGKKVKHPSNYRVRIGTPLRALIESVGADMEATGKIINGGPMMGKAICNIDAAVTKGTSGVLLMQRNKSLRGQQQECIKCAKCVSACPMALEPYMLSRLAQMRRYADIEPLRVTDCIECGSCSYTCPSQLPLLDYIRVGKSEVMKIMRARK